MEKILIEKMNLDKLQKSINELRDVLNEICASADENENADAKLFVSRCLDELIVEYMNIISNKTEGDILDRNT